MDEAPRDFGFNTRAVHAGQRPDPYTGASATPIYQTAGFVFEDTESASAYFNLQEYGNVYSRIMNPTVAAFEERLANLEGGVGAVAFASGRLADRVGRKPIFLVAFLALILRGLLFAVSRNPTYLVCIEALDGIGTGISGVLTVLIVSDLAKDTGRFNLSQGTLQACLSLGSFFGNLTAGFSAKSFGFPATFVWLACTAIAGLFLASRMPETLERLDNP